MTLAAAPAEPELMVGHAPKLGKKHHHEQNEGYGRFFLHHMDKRWEEFQNDKLCNNERALDNHFDVCVFHSLQTCQIYSPQIFGFHHLSWSFFLFFLVVFFVFFFLGLFSG